MPRPKGFKQTPETIAKIKLNAKPHGKKHTEETKEKLRQINLGKKLSEETKQKISLKSKELNTISSCHTAKVIAKQSINRKGRAPWNKGQIMSEEYCNLYGQKGELCHFWKGGYAAKNAEQRKRARSTSEYKKWRKEVIQRDNATCQMKDDSCSHDIHVDHIKSWSEFEELRFDINNGRVLCAFHHRRTETYGGNQLKGKSLVEPIS